MFGDPPGLARSNLNKIPYAKMPKEVTASVTNAIVQRGQSRIGGIAGHYLRLTILTSIDTACGARPGRSPASWVSMFCW